MNPPDTTPPAPRAISDEDLKNVLWSIALSDHMGDVAEAITPLLAHFGLEETSLSQLLDALVRRDLIPDYARQN